MWAPGTQPAGGGRSAEPRPHGGAGAGAGVPFRCGSSRRGQPSCGRCMRESTQRPSPAGSKRCCRAGRSCWPPVRTPACTSAPRPMPCDSTARPETCCPGWMASPARSGQPTSPGAPPPTSGFLPATPSPSAIPFPGKMTAANSWVAPGWHLGVRHCTKCFLCIRTPVRPGPGDAERRASSCLLAFRVAHHCPPRGSVTAWDGLQPG